jgi:hypothetical protein
MGQKDGSNLLDGSNQCAKSVGDNAPNELTTEIKNRTTFKIDLGN